MAPPDLDQTSTDSKTTTNAIESNLIDKNSKETQENPQPEDLKNRNTDLAKLDDKSISTHHNPITKKYHPFMLQTETSIEDVRIRLKKAISQTRELRVLFTDRIQSKFQIPLPPVPGFEEIITQCTTPGNSDRLKWQMTHISSNTGNSKRHPESRLLKSLLLAGHNIPTTGGASVQSSPMNGIKHYGNGHGSSSFHSSASNNIHQNFSKKRSMASVKKAVKREVGEHSSADSQHSNKRRALHLGNSKRQSFSRVSRRKTANGHKYESEPVIFEHYPSLRRVKRNESLPVMENRDAVTERALQSMKDISSIMLDKYSIENEKVDNGKSDRDSGPSSNKAFVLNYQTPKDEVVWQELNKLSAATIKANNVLTAELSKIQQAKSRNASIDESSKTPISEYFKKKQIDPTLCFSVLVALGLISRPRNNIANSPLLDAIKNKVHGHCDDKKRKLQSCLSSFVELKPRKKANTVDGNEQQKKAAKNQNAVLIKGTIENSCKGNKIGSKGNLNSSNVENGQKNQVEYKGESKNFPLHVPSNVSIRENIHDQIQQHSHRYMKQSQQQSSFNNSASFVRDQRHNYSPSHHHSQPTLVKMQPSQHQYIQQHSQVLQTAVDQFKTVPSVQRQQHLSRTSSNQSDSYNGAMRIQGLSQQQAFSTQNSVLTHHYVVNGAGSQSQWDQNNSRSNISSQNTYDMGISSMYKGQSPSQQYHNSQQYGNNTFTAPIRYSGRQDMQISHSTMPHPLFNGNSNGRRHSAIRTNDVYDPRSVSMHQQVMHQRPPQSMLSNHIAAPQVPQISIHSLNNGQEIINQQQPYVVQNGSRATSAPTSSSYTSHSSCRNSQSVSSSISAPPPALQVIPAQETFQESKSLVANKNTVTTTLPRIELKITSQKNDETQHISTKELSKKENASRCKKELKFNVPKPAPGLSKESAHFVVCARFHMVKSDEKGLALEYLLSMRPLVPIPSDLILKPLNEKLLKSIVSKEAVASVALLWLWKEHRKDFQKAYQENMRFDKDHECKKLINMVLDSCTRVIFEAERMKRFEKAGNELAATLVSEALGGMLYFSRKCDEIIPFISESLTVLDQLRIEKLKLYCRERVYLANLVARQACLSEKFANVYVQLMVQCGECVGHENLAELVQDEDVQVSSLFVHDVILNGVGKAWEDPCRPLPGFALGLKATNLVYKAHAKAQLQRSLYNYQKNNHIGGGTPNAGIYCDGPCHAVSMIAPALRGVKRKSDSSDFENNVILGSATISAHNCPPLELETQNLGDTPYGNHVTTLFVESYKRPNYLMSSLVSSEIEEQSASDLPLDDSKEEGKILFPSSYPIEWEEVTSQFKPLKDPSPDTCLESKVTLPNASSEQNNANIDSMIFSPSVKMLDKEQMNSMLNEADSDVALEEDISDDAIIQRHKVVLEDMKEKLDRLVEARKSRYRTVSSH